MAKTDETKLIEKALMVNTRLKRTFGCPEVTIGWYGRKRVDFMETNTNAVIRCYEIKVTKADFKSKHGHNFEGNYNYYVMPRSLYNEVKDDIPNGVGVLVPNGIYLNSVKKASYKKLDEKTVHDMLLYLIRSMSREVKKSFDSKQKETLAYWKRTADQWERKYREAWRENRLLKRKNKQKSV